MALTDTEIYNLINSYSGADAGPPTTNSPIGTDAINLELDDQLRNLKSILRKESINKAWQRHRGLYGTLAFVSATQFTVSLTGTNQTDIFSVGRRVKASVTGNTRYGTITVSTYSDPLTTVTVDWDDATGLDASLSEVQVGVIDPLTNALSFEYATGGRSVREFGAKGDGTTDDATAFNNAIAAVPTGGTLIIPPGTYLLSTGITITKAINILGAGLSATKLKGASIAILTLAPTSAVYGSSVRNLDIEFTNSNAANIGIDVGDGLVANTLINIEGVRIFSTATTAGTAIRLRSAAMVTIDSCRITAINLGIDLNAATGEGGTISVRNTEITSTVTTGIRETIATAYGTISIAACLINASTGLSFGATGVTTNAFVTGSTFGCVTASVALDGQAFFHSVDSSYLSGVGWVAAATFTGKATSLLDGYLVSIANNGTGVIRVLYPHVAPVSITGTGPTLLMNSDTSGNVTLNSKKVTGVTTGTASGEVVTAERAINITGGSGGGNLTADRTLTVTKQSHQTVHTWTVSGEVKVPAGDTDFICPFFVPVLAGTTVTLKRARYVINSGTSVTAKLQKGGVDVTGYTGISVTTTAATTTQDAALADTDKLALVVTAVSGTPKNMSFSLFFEIAATY